MRLEGIKSLRPLRYCIGYALYSFNFNDFLKETGCNLKFPFLRRYLRDVWKTFPILTMTNSGKIERWIFNSRSSCVIEESICLGAGKEIDELIKWIEENILEKA